MNAILIQSRFLPCLIVLTLSTLSLPSLARAEDPVLAQDACQLRWDDEELCGWATHDSIAYRYVPPTEPASASDTTIDGSITQGAAIAFASAGISVEQLLEPLAMVTPYIDNSFQKVRQYQSWWGAAIATAKQLRQDEAQQESSVAAQLSRIAAEEPVDIGSLGPSVVVDEFPLTTQFIPEGETGIEILPLHRSVGSTAIIVTIEEAYLPYDLKTEDLKLWSVLPESTRPFCIRADTEHHDPMHRHDTAAMWRAFDQRVASERQVVPTPQPVLAYCGSADCLLEAWIWNAENFVAADSKLWQVVNTENVGRHLATVSLRRQQWVQVATTLLASHWETSLPVPVEEPSMEASPTGAALLTRAGAIAASEPVIEVADIGNALR